MVILLIEHFVKNGMMIYVETIESNILCLILGCGGIQSTLSIWKIIPKFITLMKCWIFIVIIFIEIVYLFHNYNVTVLWRDTSPAGSCTIPDPFENYHTSLSTMNMIAHSSLKEIGVVIISGIWDISLPYWKHHKGCSDLVHYCLYQNQSLMNLWIKKTITTILEN